MNREASGGTPEGITVKCLRACSTIVVVGREGEAVGSWVQRNARVTLPKSGNTALFENLRTIELRSWSRGIIEHVRIHNRVEVVFVLGRRGRHDEGHEIAEDRGG